MNGEELRSWVGWIVITVVVVVAAIPARADWDDIDWFDDAGGYAKAVAAAEELDKPVLVYFYTEWCPYCRQLNEELLSSADVQSVLAGMLAVRVNPERGPDERSLAAHYRVRGYPALFVYSTTGENGFPGGDFQPIRRTVRADEGVRLKTPEEFVATLEAAAR